jgi:hypothetical protein
LGQKEEKMKNIKTWLVAILIAVSTITISPVYADPGRGGHGGGGHWNGGHWSGGCFGCGLWLFDALLATDIILPGWMAANIGNTSTLTKHQGLWKQQNH